MTAAAKSVRSVKKLERPRPLKLAPGLVGHPSGDGAGDLLQDLEITCKHISNGNYDMNVQCAISQLCTNLKAFGAQLDFKYKDLVDRYFVSLRNGCRDDRLDILSRVKLLEIIELRARNWQSNENINNYYRQKAAHAELGTILPGQGLNPGSPVFNFTTPGMLQQQVGLSSESSLVPGEVIKSSGKYRKPVLIASKNYFKDEIIIRNSDSGKVMGIKGRRVHMIEELSETIISFQRVSPGARDRLVQITGPSEESVNRAKGLIEETIFRNASPIRERPSGEFGSSSSLNSGNSDDNFNQSHGTSVRNHNVLQHSYSMNDANLSEYKYTVLVGNEIIRVVGANLDLVRTAKLVLDEYFAGDHERSVLVDGGSGDGAFSPDLQLSPNTPGNNDSLKHSTSNSDFSGSQDTGSEDTFKGSLDGGGSQVKDAKDLPFNGDSPKKESHQPKAGAVKYTREFLLKCALSPLSLKEPKGLPHESQLCLRKNKKAFDPSELLKEGKSAPSSEMKRDATQTSPAG